MAEERLCGTEKCLISLTREDIKDTKNEIQAIRESQMKMLEIMSKQESIFSWLKVLQDEFNRSRDGQAEINKQVSEKLDNVVTVSYLKWALSFATFVILVISFIFNYAIK